VHQETSSGVLLVKVLQKAENLTTFPGTFIRPKTDVEKRQNINKVGFMSSINLLNVFFI